MLTAEIYAQMKKDDMPYVWLSMEHISKEELEGHFPNIVSHCRDKGFDVFHECIPVVPAQHYFMGGIEVDLDSCTSMQRLFAVGETACNGVHGKNRLASNSLLESLVFARRAAEKIKESPVEEKISETAAEAFDASRYQDRETLAEIYKKNVRNEIERLNNYV